MRRLSLLVSILFLAVIVIPASATKENESAGSPKQLPYQYAVKFICGRQPMPGQPQVLARGLYFTAINVHNPSEDSVGILKRFAVALPGEKAGPLSPVFQASLKADEAFEIDCADIIKHLHAHGPFVKGFAIIESKTELDVVAVYTAAGSTGAVETMHIERVPVRRQ